MKSEIIYKGVCELISPNTYKLILENVSSDSCAKGGVQSFDFHLENITDVSQKYHELLMTIIAEMRKASGALRFYLDDNLSLIISFSGDL